MSDAHVVHDHSPEVIKNIVHSLPEGTESNPYRHRLIRYYKLYNRDKLPEVEAFLTSFWGNWEDMMGRVVATYGPEPPTEDYKTRVARMYNHYDPTKLENIDMALESFAGFEEDMFCVLVSKYGLEPEPPTPRGQDTLPERDRTEFLRPQLHVSDTTDRDTVMGIPPPHPLGMKLVSGATGSLPTSDSRQRVAQQAANDDAAAQQAPLVSTAPTLS